MSLVRGILNNYQVAAAVPFTSNVTLATIGLASPIAANQTQHFRAYVPFTIGATGGIRFSVVCGTASTVIKSWKIVDTVTPSITPGQSTNPNNTVTNALAVAGSHYLEIEGTITNGATAGTIDIQVAQNTSDVATLTFLKGGFMEVVAY